MERGRPREMAGISAAVRELAAESGISERHAWRLARQRGMTQPRSERMTAKQLAAKDKVSVRTVFRSVQYFHAVDKIANSLGHGILDTILAGDVKLSQRDALRLARVQPQILVHAWKKIRDATTYTQVRKIVREACQKEAKGNRAQMQELLR